MSNDKINPQIMFLFAFIFAPVCLFYTRGLFLTSGRPCANSGRSFLDVFQILPETKPFLLNFLCKNGPYIPSFLLSLPCSLRRAFSPFQRIGVCSRTQTLTHRGSLWSHGAFCMLKKAPDSNGISRNFSSFCRQSAISREVVPWPVRQPRAYLTLIEGLAESLSRHVHVC